MDKNEVITKVREYKDLLSKQMHIEQVFLFGSYAKENYREDSDIDVAIVVSNLSGDFFAVNPLLWKLRRQVDDRIEPVLIERDYDQAGFLNEIKKEGIEII